MDRVNGVRNDYGSRTQNLQVPMLPQIPGFVFSEVERGGEITDPPFLRTYVPYEGCDKVML